MERNEQIAADILSTVGKDNVLQAAHCMTRLRLNLKDENAVDDEAVKNIDGVTGIIKAGGQYQIIIGQNVPKVYDAFLKQSGLSADAAEAAKPKQKLTFRGVGNAILNYMAGSMTPVLPIVLAGGMFRAILAILGPDLLKVLDPASSEYAVLNLVYEIAFYFMPVFLGYSAAKKLGSNPMLGMALGAVLLAPSFINLVNAGDPLTFLGLPVRLVNYSQSILPIMLCVWIMSYVEGFFKKTVPDALSTLFVPFLTLLCMVPVSLIVLAPLGAYLGDFVSGGLIRLGSVSGFLGVAVLSALWQFLVMSGMHLVLIYAGYDLFLSQGYDTFILPCMAIAFMAAAGLALGAFLKFKNKKEKAVAGGYLASAIIGGVTEPTLYGIGIRYKKPMIAMAVGAFAGGAYAGLTGVQYLIPGAPAFLMPLTFVGGSTANLVNGTIAIFLAFIVAAALTYLFGFDPSEPALRKEGETAEEAGKIYAPISGQYIPMEEIPDAMFAQGMMGKTIGIKPEKGEVIAPVSGLVTVAAETKHAVGITTDSGAEILIHVGMDTVNLNGEGFKMRVKQGDRVNRGELLIKFKLKDLEEKGVETTSAFCITNPDQFSTVELDSTGAHKAGEEIGRVEK